MLKGDPKTTVFVVFPMSYDVAWAKSPKLKIGQKGTFILKPFTQIQMKIRAGIYFSALDRCQFQPK